jgi:hypothetical protein
MMSTFMPSFEGDFFGKRCVSGARSGDVFNVHIEQCGVC